MYDLIVQNKYGQQLKLTGNPAYTIKEIDGINPPDATINTTRNANADGSRFNSSHVNDRQIILNLAINAPTEDNRINLYKYFKNKYPVRIYYSNDTRNVYIDGHCQSIQIGFFQKKQSAVITILCPEPFFNGSDSVMTDFSNVQSLFEFPFSIEEPIPFSEIIYDAEKTILNGGDVETGAEIFLEATGYLSNPAIYNTGKSEYFKLNLSMIEGDEIYINTKTGKKEVLLTRNGETSNIISHLEIGSSWFSFDPGDNLFMITADTNPENLSAYCIITNQFEGV